MKEYNIILKELFLIVVVVEVWGYVLQNLCVIFYFDNVVVVNIVNVQILKDLKIMILVRRLVLVFMKYNILFFVEYILGLFNILFDLFLWLQVKIFLEVLLDSEDELIVILSYFLQLFKIQLLF